MKSLVGYTGFVGSNIREKGVFDGLYNSKSISSAYGTNPDLLVYAGLRAEKYLANTNPNADMQLIYQAEDNIRKISPKKLVLISTIDVFKDPSNKDEDSNVSLDGLHPYGFNRYRLEQWVEENHPNSLIIRLPGLYGINIKKNFIYDFINVIPFMLKESKFSELSEMDNELAKYYSLQDNGFYKCNLLNEDEKVLLKEKFRRVGFSALNFTDSRNVYQFYPLSRLWNDIQIALDNDLHILHPATEPVSAASVYKYLTGKEFVNYISDSPVYYDYKTKYSGLFGGTDGYLMSSQQVLEDIKRFVWSEV